MFKYLNFLIMKPRYLITPLTILLFLLFAAHSASAAISKPPSNLGLVGYKKPKAAFLRLPANPNTVRHSGLSPDVSIVYE